MSFILDALRKSDAERQRTAAPGLADVRYASRPSRRNIWLPILVAVLAANAVFIGIRWFGLPGARPAAGLAAPGPAALPQSPAPPVATQEPAPASAIRPLAREAEFGEPELEPPVESVPALVPVPRQRTETASSVPPPPTAPALAQEPEPASLPSSPSRIVADDGLPTAEQVIGSGVNMPILNLDLHVYSEQSANRFVIINSHKYKEGGQLSEGPTVEKITKDGVILIFQGRQFTLSRR